MASEGELMTTGTTDLGFMGPCLANISHALVESALTEKEANMEI
jgi:hypothetical protein